MAQLLSTHGKHRVFILGAGFNAPLGMPLTADLLRQVHAVAAGKPLLRDGAPPAAHGMADWLVQVLDWYYPLHGITHESIRSDGFAARFDLEEFLSFVAATSAMEWRRERGSNEHGDRFSACLKSWLGEAIERQQRDALQAVPAHYLRFAASLRDAVVLTFNWNTVVERLLDRLGIPYAFDLPGALASGALPLVKLHGSTDWFSLPSRGEPPPSGLDLAPLGDIFDGIGRAKADVLRYYEAGLTPWLVVPSYDKIFQVLNLGAVWQLPWDWLDDELEVVIIGYSIRPDDYHSRALLYPRLVRGSRGGRLRVTVVERAEGANGRDEIARRFAGVEGCRFWTEGFSAEALDFIERRQA
jgi:hypothetical protein